jgi:hypothetical protein
MSGHKCNRLDCQFCGEWSEVGRDGDGFLRVWGLLFLGCVLFWAGVLWVIL